MVPTRQGRDPNTIYIPPRAGRVSRARRRGCIVLLTEFRQPIQVQSHLEMPGILVQLGRIQRT